MRRQAVIKNGTTFGFMKVMKEVKPRIRNNGDIYRYFLMKCRCGNEHVSPLQSLRNGHSTSCGCAKRNFLINFNLGKDHSGEKSPRWIQDRTQLSRFSYKGERSSPAYKSWRKQVIKRDGHKCKMNNSDCGGQLEVHHILGWREHPELGFDINNGITLCHAHHPLVRSEEKRLIPVFKELVSVSNVGLF